MMARYRDLISGGRPANPSPDDRRVSAEPFNMNVPSLDTVISEAEYLVFDTELTGLRFRRASIVSIGAVKMKGTRISLGDNFHRIVEPRTALTGSSVIIHGITPSEASEAPTVDMVLPEFLDLCRGRVLVGHVVSMDLRFINMEMNRIYGRMLPNPAVDTMALYGFLRKREGDYCAFHEGVPGRADLFSIAREKGIPFTLTHDALYDAYVTAQLLQRFLTILPQYGVHTLRDLRRVGKA
jgi:DNA polymerase-3 subunit epsilon